MKLTHSQLHFLWEHALCHKNGGRGGVRLREGSQGWNKVTVILLDGGSPCVPILPILPNNSLSTHAYVCVSRTLFFSWQVCRSPQGLLFSTTTLMWSDRTASSALLWGDLHCGGDPRVWLVVDNNRKKDLKRTRLFLSLRTSEAVTSSSHSLFLSLCFSFFLFCFFCYTFRCSGTPSENSSRRPTLKRSLYHEYLIANSLFVRHTLYPFL